MHLFLWKVYQIIWNTDWSSGQQHHRFCSSRGSRIFLEEGRIWYWQEATEGCQKWRIKPGGNQKSLQLIPNDYDNLKFRFKVINKTIQ